MPKQKQFQRGEIHIFTEDPSKYSEILPKQIMLYITLEEVTDAIERNQKLIFTTQIYFLSHMWIKAGYDLILYDNGCTIKFGDEYLDLMGLRYHPQSYYYMQELLMWGDLYQIP